MKTTLYSIILVLCIGLFSIVSADQLDDAVSWMHEHKLTIFNQTSDFDPNRGLRRDEAAKFYVKFAHLLGKTTYINSASECRFSDLHEAWPDLKDVIIESCRLGLFKGNKGKFRPQDQLTNAQAVTVLVRLLIGPQSEVGLSHRSENYYVLAREIEVIHPKNDKKDVYTTRGDVAMMIWLGNSSLDQLSVIEKKKKLLQGLSHLSSTIKSSYDSENHKIEEEANIQGCESGGYDSANRKRKLSYDPKGNKTQEIRYNKQSTFRDTGAVLEWSYDSKNNKVQEFIYNLNIYDMRRWPQNNFDNLHLWNKLLVGYTGETTNNFKSSWSFDNMGNKTEESIYYLNGFERTTLSNTKRSYDANNNAIEELTDGSKVSWSYNKYGKKIEEIFYYKNMSTQSWYPLNKTSRLYDSNGNKIQEIKYARFNSSRGLSSYVSDKTERIYDSSGKQTQQHSYTRSSETKDRISSQKLNRSYDVFGNKIQEIRYRRDGSVSSSWDIVDKTDRFYDSFGNKTKEISYGRQGVKKEELFYDTNGNKIQHIFYNTSTQYGNYRQPINKIDISYDYNNNITKVNYYRGPCDIWLK